LPRWQHETPELGSSKTFFAFIPQERSAVHGELLPEASLKRIELLMAALIDTRCVFQFEFTST